MLLKESHTHADSLDGTLNRGLFTAFVDTVVHAIYTTADDVLDWEVHAVHGGDDYLLLNADGKANTFSSDRYTLPRGSSLKVLSSGTSGRNPKVTVVWSPFTEGNVR